MNAEDKNRLFRRLPYVLSSNNIEEMDDFHRQAQKSIRLHFCAHLCYARLHLSQGEIKAMMGELWRMTCSPMATFSIRLGLDQRRRFFGLGPLR